MQVSCFVDCPSLAVCLLFLMIRFRSCIWGKNPAEVMLSSSRHPTKRHFLSIRPVTENVNFDCWVKLASASNYKVTAFLFVVNKFLLERCFETVTILLLLHISPTGFSTHRWFLSEATIITIVAKWWFLYWYFHHSFYIYYLAFSTVRKIFLFLFIYLFVHSVKCGLMDSYFIQ